MNHTSPTLGDIARAALTAQLSALIEQADDMEGVHRRRVATRRLRAVLRVFRSALPAQAEELRAELAWLGKALGAVRDLDVLLASIQAASEQTEGGPDLVAPVVEVLVERRREAWQRLQLVLDSPRYGTVLGTLRDLAACAWPDAAAAPAYQVVPRLVRQPQRRLRRAARRVRRSSPPPRLHRARIRAKQLRYTVEFVADLYGPPAQVLVKRLTRMQDALGTVQDAVTLKQHLASMGEQVPAASIAVLAHVADRRAAKARKRVRRLIRGALGKAWKRLRRQLRRGAQRDRQNRRPAVKQPVNSRIPDS